jgi:hypothetical protein
MLPFLRGLNRHRAWILLALVIVFVSAVRVRLREMPLERDEGDFAYAGQLILRGIPPYKLAYNMKLPGIYGAYALIMALFGESAAGIHLGLLVVNAATIVIMFLLGRRLLDATAGAVAATCFAFMSLSTSVFGLAAHASHFVMLFVSAGCLLLLRGMDSGKFSTLFASGLLFGAAFLMKQPGLLFGVFAMLYLCWSWIGKPKMNWSSRAKEAGCYALGLVLPFVLTCAVLWWAGVFSSFWFWTFSYARQLISIVSFSQGLEVLRRMVGVVLVGNLLFWILAAVGLAMTWWDERVSRHRAFLASFLVFSILAVCPGMFFQPHYFIFVLPALALLAGVAVSRSRHLLQQDQSIELLLSLPVFVLFAVALLYSAVMHGPIWFEATPARACDMIYHSQMFPETCDVADYIRENTSPDDRIAVLGSEPQIYFLARRLSASGYIFIYPLMLEPQKNALKMHNEMIREIEAARPAYVVFANSPWSWGLSTSSQRRILDWWREYSKTNYILAEVVDPAPDKAAEWQLQLPLPFSHRYLLVYKRRDTVG